MKPLLLGLAAALASCGLVACQAPPRTPAPGPPQIKASEKGDRQSIAVTVYNQDFGVVRDTRRLTLARGRVELSFRDVSAHIQPETVRLRTVGPGVFEVLEQNYRYDLLTPAKLLEKHVGKQISVYQYHPSRGQEEKKSAQVLSVEGGVTLLIDGEVTTNFSGRYGFAEVPPQLLDQPTLVWLLESDRPEHEVEVTYVTRKLNWRADYVLKLDATDRHADLTGWVTLDNRSGTSYEDATLRLVAGDVNRVQPPEAEADAAYDRAEESQASGRFEEEGLFEYHLYSLDRRTTLRNNETKQVALLSAEGARVQKKLVLVGEPHHYRGRHGQLQKNQKLGVFVELSNGENNRLGMPLPKGTVRVYKADQGGSLQFVGEDAIDHTPRDEVVSVRLGEAFDVVADRVQKEWTQLSSCSAETSFEIEVRNHKDRDEQVEISEPTGADWEIVQHSHPFVKVDAGTFRFDLKVPARGRAKVSYRLRLRYC